MGASHAACCVSRQADSHGSPSVRRPAAGALSRTSTWSTEDEEHLKFFECAETEAELASAGEVAQPCRAKRLCAFSACAAIRPVAEMQLVPEEAGADTQHKRPPPSRSEPLPPEIVRIISKVREGFRKRLEADDFDEQFKLQLEDGGFPELDEWSAPETAKRMLRAACGDEDQAIHMLTRAIEYRVRDRELFRTMRCEVFCDIRVIGRDKEQRPTVYVCTRNQSGSLREITPQVFLAFEAAARITAADGQITLVADMHGFKPSHNLDPCAMKELADSFGTINADRLNYILIVDFSWVAQAVWSAINPLLSDRTRRKINFASASKARNLAKERLDGPTSDRILSAFDINRLRGSTLEERQQHARRTSICDVPLGAVCETNVAG